MDYKKVAIEAAKSSGEILKSQFNKPIVIQGKGEHDLVSKVDYESEKNAIEIIRKAFPDHKIIAEESGKSGNESGFIWYIDPLDGTSNFLTGNPYFSISIGLAKNGEVILGTVYNPILDELYVAERGKGAYLNSKKILIADSSSLKNAIIASAYAAEEDKIKSGLVTVEKLVLNARKVIINFSPALDLCNIARSKIDAIVDNGTTPEDHAAGSLIVLEAGGTVKNYSSDIFDVDETGIVAGNEDIIAEIEKLL